MAGGGENGELVFNGYRISVLQNGKNYEDGWLHNIMNVFNTIELYTLKRLR